MSLNQIGKTTLMTGLIGLVAFCPMPLAYAEPDAIERCRQADTDQERIACLEAALRGPQAQVEVEDDPDKSDEPDKAEKPEIAAKQARPKETAPPEEASEDTPRSVDLGAEQVTARESRGRSSEPTPRMNAEVRGVDVIPYRRLQVTLDNGQVWRQIRGDTQRINERRAGEQTVEIWESNLGGYRMRLNEMERTIRVERIR